jgi:O-antigen/teichoic acid export membrane protein
MASEANRRIAKNTVMLYIRMLFSMVVSLYTARVILNTLGVEDYGTYNVVGGIVTLFGFINASLATGTQRFLTFELSKGDTKKLNRIFCMSLNIHVIIAIIVFLLAETKSHIRLQSSRMSDLRFMHTLESQKFFFVLLSYFYW